MDKHSLMKQAFLKHPLYARKLEAWGYVAGQLWPRLPRVFHVIGKHWGEAAGPGKQGSRQTDQLWVSLQGLERQNRDTGLHRECCLSGRSGKAWEGAT